MSWIKGELLWVRPGREASGAVFVVRKLIGKAVVRNRLKRRLRHLYRECGPVPGSLVVLAQKPAAASPYRVLRQELTDLLSRLPAPPAP
ncbi:ribonuclease P protein component [Candidatus Latescibacterota bacterium]